MKIYQHSITTAFQLFQLSIHSLKGRADTASHQPLTFNADHPKTDPGMNLKYLRWPPGSCRQIIGRSHEIFQLCNGSNHLLLIPEMIAGGKTLHTRLLHLPKNLARHSLAMSGIFNIRDNEINPVMSPDLPKPFPNCLSPRLSKDVANKK